MKILIRFGIAASVMCVVVLLGLSPNRGAGAQNVPPVKTDHVTELIQPWIDKNQIPGALVYIGTKDSLTDVETLGYQDIKKRVPYKRTDEFWIASMSKPMAAICLMMLVDDGKVNVDDPVEKYLSEFKDQKVRAVRHVPGTPDDGLGQLAPATHPITIREIMSHTAGLPFQSHAEHEPLDQRPLKDAVRTYAAEPLLYQPGTDYTYSNEDLNTTGRIVEVVSGMPYEEFLQKRLLDPLGMKSTTFWPNKEQIARLAKSYELNPNGGEMIEIPLKQVAYPLDDHKHRYPIPAGGLFSTADDCLALIQMLANRGVYHGTRILSDASFHEMTSLQNKGLGHTQYGFGIDVGKGNISHSGHHKTFMGAHMKTGTVLVFMTQVDGKPELQVDGKVEHMDSLWNKLLDLGDKMSATAMAKP